MENRNAVTAFIYVIIQVCTAMIGYTIHSSIFWAIMDFIFVPFAWIKWLVLHQVSLSIIKETFSFLLS